MTDLRQRVEEMQICVEGGEKQILYHMALAVLDVKLEEVRPKVDKLIMEVTERYTASQRWIATGAIEITLRVVHEAMAKAAGEPDDKP